MLKQFAEFEDISKLNKGLELQVMRPLLLNLDTKENDPQINANLWESKQIQLSADIPQQLESTLVKEDSNQDETKNSPLWSMFSDGFCTKTNIGAGVWITNTENNHIENISCKLNFKCSNNIAKYESLLLGLRLLKKIGAKRIKVHGDSELVIRQVSGEYNANHPKLRAFQNDVMDLLKTFED